MINGAAYGDQQERKDFPDVRDLIFIRSHPAPIIGLFQIYFYIPLVILMRGVNIHAYDCVPTQSNSVELRCSAIGRRKAVTGIGNFKCPRLPICPLARLRPRLPNHAVSVS